MNTQLSLVTDQAGRRVDFERHEAPTCDRLGTDPLDARPGIGITVQYHRGQTIVVEGDPTSQTPW